MSELTSTEQRILEHLTARGETTAGSVARLTGIKRPTVYAALNRLIALGLAELRKAGSATYFKALPPPAIKRSLVYLAEQRLAAANREAADLEARLKAIKTQAPQRIAGYEIRAVEIRETVYGQLEGVLLKGHFTAFFNPQVVCAVKEVKEIVARFLTLSAKLSPPIREICVAGPLTDWYVGNIRNPNHEVRLLASDTMIHSDMIITDGSIILSHYNPHEELAIMITQPDFFASMSAIFEEVWRYAKPACAGGKQ